MRLVQSCKHARCGRAKAPAPKKIQVLMFPDYDEYRIRSEIAPPAIMLLLAFASKGAHGMYEGNTCRASTNR